MEQIAMHAVEQVAVEALPRKSTHAQREDTRQEAVQGFSVDHTPENLNPRENADNPFGSNGAGERPGNTIPGAGHDLSVMIKGNLVAIKDQIQMYTTNQLISHPLVSPVLQPSLGGLPPLLVLTGGGEVLRDEQIYLAHKAANPAKYLHGEAYLDEYPNSRDLIDKYKPTDVQLQIWDDLCHVAPTLSFTRPAKYMYRSIAQFGAWALARAQKAGIEIMDDDEVSLISSGSDDESEEDLKNPKETKSTMKNGVAQGGTVVKDQVGRAGEALPPFKNHMIRQRVDRHGHVFPLDAESSLPALRMLANEIGVIKPGPVQKWLEAKKQWDTKYAREKRKVQKNRVKEMAQGYQGFGDDEVPPPSALAGRRGLNMPKEEKKSRSWGMSMWALWGSSHDENTVHFPTLCLNCSLLICSRSPVKKKQRRKWAQTQSPILMSQMLVHQGAIGRIISRGQDHGGGQSLMLDKLKLRTDKIAKVHRPSSYKGSRREMFRPTVLPLIITTCLRPPLQQARRRLKRTQATDLRHLHPRVPTVPQLAE